MLRIFFYASIAMLLYSYLYVANAEEYKDLNVYGKAKFHTVETAKATKRGFIKASNGTWNFIKKWTPRLSWRKDEKEVVDNLRNKKNKTLYQEVNK